MKWQTVRSRWHTVARSKRSVNGGAAQAIHIKDRRPGQDNTTFYREFTAANQVGSGGKAHPCALHKNKDSRQIEFFPEVWKPDIVLFQNRRESCP